MKVVVSDAILLPFRHDLEVALPAGSIVLWPNPDDDHQVEKALDDADVFVTFRCTTEMARAGRSLRLVQVTGAGTDLVEMAALPWDTKVANTFHHEASIAEYVLASTVVLRREILRQDAALRRGVWASPVFDRAEPLTNSLSEATVGLVGFGHIGARAWQLFRACDARGVAVTQRGLTDAAAHGLEWAGTIQDLNALLDIADVVVLSVPLTPETVGLIDTPQLSRMGASTVLVNVGRGPVINQRALFDALHNNRIAGAAIDVWYDYPQSGSSISEPAELPFRDLPNVLMTPHSSGVTRQTFVARTADIIGNINRLAAGQPLRNVVAILR